MIDIDSVSEHLLKATLELIRDIDQLEPIDYDERAKLIYQAMAMATRQGHEVGFRLDPSEPEWPVAYIELPTGQVSWHMPQFHKPYDGHTTEEKYRRITAWT